MSVADADDGFLSRWSRRKQQARGGEAKDETVSPASAVRPEPELPGEPGLLQEQAAQPAAPTDPRTAEPPPTLDDVAVLAPGDEITRFVARGVDPGVKNAALRKLFADPHYNLMDGLDIYIDDYGKPDPIPPEMLRQMVQSKFLGLFDDEQDGADAAQASVAGPAPLAAAPLQADNPTSNEDADLRVQQDDGAGRPGIDPGAGPGAG